MSKIIKFNENRVWRTYIGGKLLDEIAGHDNASDTHFPEDWIGSTIEARNVGREEVAEGLAYITDTQGDTVSFKEILQRDLSSNLGEGKENHIP